MLLYENAVKSNYEEIKTMYPVWYWDIFDMDVLWKIYGRKFDEIQEDISQAVNNNFIDYADSRTITDYEIFLYITYDGARTLAERRAVVKAFMLGNGHIGQKEIKELISVFTDGEITVAFANGIIQVSVTRDWADRFNLYDCHLVLDKKIPAHLALGLTDKPYPIKFFTDDKFIFIDLNVGCFIDEHENQNVSFEEFGVNAKIKTGNNLTGKIRYVNMWRLDGSVKLNGSRKLNASLTEIEEDL